MLAALAYTRMQRLHKIVLAGTDLARATAATMRVQRLKIAIAERRRGAIRAAFASS